MPADNESRSERTIRPEGLGDTSQQQAFIDKCLHEAIDTIQVPELDAHQLFQGKLSLLAWVIYTGQMDLLVHLQKAGYAFAKTSDKCPPLVTAILFGQLAIAEYLSAHGLGTWGDTYRGYGIVYHALIEGHSLLAKELVRLGYASWAESVPPGINLVQAALLGGSYALAEELVQLGHSWSVKARLIDIFHSHFPQLRVLTGPPFVIDSKLTARLQQTIVITPMLQAAIHGKEQALYYLVNCQLGNWLEPNTFMNALCDFFQNDGLDLKDSSRSDPDTALTCSNPVASQSECGMVHWSITSTLCLFGHFELWQKLSRLLALSEVPEEYLAMISLMFLSNNQTGLVVRLAQLTSTKQSERKSANLMEMALSRHDFKLVHWLVEQGFSDWDHVYEYGEQIFHYAIEYGFEELCDWLISHNYNSWSDFTKPDNASGRKACNALTLAIKSHQFALARKLISQGHFDGLSPNPDKTPFYLALERGDTHFIRWMVESGYGQWTETFGPSENSILHVMASHSNFEPMQAIQQLSGIAWSTKNSFNDTILSQIFSSLRRSDIPYKQITNIAQQYPQAIVASTNNKSSPLAKCLTNNLRELFEEFVRVLKTHNLIIPSHVIESILKLPDRRFTALLLDYDFLALETLENLINLSLPPANQALLRAEHAIRSADYTSQGLHIKAEQFIFDALSKPHCDYQVAIDQLLATLPARLHPAFALRVAPRLDVCLAQIAWDSSRLSHPQIRDSIKHIIQAYSSAGCFYLEPKRPPLLFTYQRPRALLKQACRQKSHARPPEPYSGGRPA